MARYLYRVHVLDADDDAGRVRLRVLLVHHEPWWNQEELLPEGPGFFLQVLREAADGRFGLRPEGPLGEAVSETQVLDPAYVGANAGRFVRRVERVSVANHPVDAELAAFYRDNHDALHRLFFTSTFVGNYDPDRDRPLEERLVQADYDVRVTDPRWVRTLSTSQVWGSDAWESAVTAADASASLGFLLWEDDPDGAVAAYRRAIELGDERTRVTARLELDKLLAGRDRYAYDHDQECQDALELAFRLHQEGNQREARLAYAKAVCMRDVDVVAEARRRAGFPVRPSTDWSWPGRVNSPGRQRSCASPTTRDRRPWPRSRSRSTNATSNGPRRSTTTSAVPW